MFNELDVLKDIKERFNCHSDKIAVGIGDDCAAVKAGSDLTLYSSDTVLEGIHFSTSYMTCREIARKAVSVSVSDIAAMGGSPDYFLSTIGIPKCTPQNQIDELLDGFNDSSGLYGVQLIGGNITTSEKLFIDITVIGHVDNTNIVRRAGASAGDLVFVTGTLGDSAMGLEILKLESRSGDQYLEKRHKDPRARTEAGKLLGDNQIPSSMIDISDGFLIDLERITVEYGLGADIFLEKIPVSKSYGKLQKSSEVPLSFALSGGEDYELLFTVPAGNIAKIKKISSTLDVNISEIGVVNNNKKIDLYGNDKKIFKYRDKGFVHL